MVFSDDAAKLFITFLTGGTRVRDGRRVSRYPNTIDCIRAFSSSIAQTRHLPVIKKKVWDLFHRMEIWRIYFLQMR